MEFKYLKVEINENIALLTINSPQTMNALNSKVLTELEAALYGLNLDDSVKVVLLTGAGDKAFVAGADIVEMSKMTPTEGHLLALKGQSVMSLVEKMRKPVIAVVNGYALGGGLELALACDFIYASSKARFGFPEVTLGIMPGFGGTQNLARLIGVNQANEMIFTGEMINAEKALALGIVNQLFAPEDLLLKARETAATIASKGSIGVAFAKDAICNGLNMSKEDGLRYEASLFGLLFDTKDQQEGMTAFIEKRKAIFCGK